MVDYEGKLATVLFTGGCNMRCPFCHNAGLVLDVANAEPLSPYDIIAHLKKRKGLVDAVVISGGEPTLQKDLFSFICEIKHLGYLVKLDSNGLNPECLETLFAHKLLDYVAMDVKNSREKYAVTSGVNADQSKIDASIKLIIDNAPDYEFRTTVIDELHDNEDIKEIVERIRGAKKYFMQKYVDNDNCIKGGFHAPSKEKAEGFRAIAQSVIPYVGLRGF